MNRYECSFYFGESKSDFMMDYVLTASTPFEATRIIESLYGHTKYFRWSRIPQPKGD